MVQYYFFDIVLYPLPSVISTTSTSVQIPQPLFMLSYSNTKAYDKATTECGNEIVMIHTTCDRFYLTLSFSSFPLPSPLLPGFLQSSVVWVLLKLASFLKMGCSVGHDFTLLLFCVFSLVLKFINSA